jgi:hypothetical protein
MIRNETEYQEALRRLDQDRDVAARQRAALEADPGCPPGDGDHARGRADPLEPRPAACRSRLNGNRHFHERRTV